jgi:hypothetical protein
MLIYFDKKIEHIYGLLVVQPLYIYGAPDVTVRPRT